MFESCTFLTTREVLTLLMAKKKKKKFVHFHDSQVLRLGALVMLQEGNEFLIWIEEMGRKIKENGKINNHSCE